MKRMIGATIAMTLLGSTAVFAQAGAYRSEQQQVQAQNRIIGESQSARGYAQDQNQNDQAQYDRGANSNEVRDNPHWSRGDKLPPEYRSNQYVVSDWRSNHLKRPPRGYHWVRVNNQYVLAAVAGGVIADIIMNAERGR
jgi:Ni/Co efflux regulator RcnB